MSKDMCEKRLTDQHIRAPTEPHSRTSEERERIQQHYKEVALCRPHCPASADLDQDITRQALQNKMTQYLFHSPECIFHDFYFRHKDASPEPSQNEIHIPRNQQIWNTVLTGLRDSKIQLCYIASSFHCHTFRLEFKMPLPPAEKN